MNPQGRPRKDRPEEAERVQRRRLEISAAIVEQLTERGPMTREDLQYSVGVASNMLMDSAVRLALRRRQVERTRTLRGTNTRCYCIPGDPRGERKPHKHEHEHHARHQRADLDDFSIEVEDGVFA